MDLFRCLGERHRPSGAKAALGRNDPRVLEREVDFQGALTWLNSHLGDRVSLSVGAAPERTHRNWSIQAHGVLRQGPGERQLIDHLGGVVRDFVIGETRVQLVEDDLRSAVAMADPDEDEYLHLNVGDAQINFFVES